MSADDKEQEETTQKKKPKMSKKKKAAIVVGILLVLIAIIAGVVYYVGHRYYTKTNYMSDEEVQAMIEKQKEEQQQEEAAEEETEEVQEEEETDPELLEAQQNMAQYASTEPITTDGNVYNIMLVGLDTTDKGWIGNSDSMILISINYRLEQISMISLMRDTHVMIPGIGYRKLNATYPNGGGPLLTQTVEENYKIDVDRYVTVDFGSMIDIIDEIGSIELTFTPKEAENANKSIKQQCRILGLKSKKYLIPGEGTYQCNGMQAVAYARIRKVGNSDYQRTERQREVLLKLLDKVKEMSFEDMDRLATDQKAYCRSKKGCMSDEEKEAANKRCPSERYHECALEQSFMELLYSMKRDFEQHGDASMIVAMFDNAYEQAVRLANNNSISVQRMATVENQIKEMEERLQDAISHQVAALREAALEQNVELNEALSNGEVTIDDIDLDIRSGLTPGSIGVSFYGTETEEGSEAQIYTELVNDLQERLKTLQQERQTIEEEQGVLAIMKKNFEYFLACLKELPDTNAGGMPLRVNGLDVQGTLLRDVDGNAIEGRKRAITSGKLKLTPERIAEAPDMLHFEKGIYCAFVESGVLQGDVATYKTNFGVTLTSKGNRRTLDSFMGYKRSDMDGNVVYVDAPYKVYGFSIQYRRYLTTAAKREREEAV